MTFLIFIVKVLITTILFLFLEYIAYQMTEKWTLPEWLNHKPFNCRICCQFWLNIFACTAFMIATHWIVPCIFWYILTILETIALKIAENNNYIDEFEEYEDK